MSITALLCGVNPPIPADPVPSLHRSGVEDDKPQGRRLFGFSPLPRSGLLGPVLITPLKQVQIKW